MYRYIYKYITYGPILVLIWWFVKLTWLVNLSSWLVCHVELVTASGTCVGVCCFVFIKSILGNRYGPGVSPQVGFVTYEKNLPASAGNFFPQNRYRAASEKVFTRFFSPFLAFCRLSKQRVFGWTRCEIWLSRKPPSTYFSRYKQSRSDTGSAQKIEINKERESERFSHQRRKMSQ